MNPTRWGAALTVGGGMDYDLPFFNNRFSLRLFQADYRYMHDDFGPSPTHPDGRRPWAAAPIWTRSN